jgi:hypothetical protein
VATRSGPATPTSRPRTPIATAKGKVALGYLEEWLASLNYDEEVRRSDQDQQARQKRAAQKMPGFDADPKERAKRVAGHGRAGNGRRRWSSAEINEGLNVIESWNRANSVIFYGKGGYIATNRRDEQQMAVLCLRILQAALVYVNTLMLQDVLTDPGWSEALTSEDQRGLTPLFWMHVLPYGEIRLDMTSRLSLSPPEAIVPADKPVSSPQDHR